MLGVKLCNVKLDNPTILASGFLGTSVEIMERVANNGAGAVTTKSIGPVGREGNNNPSVLAIKNGIYNAVGLPSPGYLNMEEEFKRWKLNVPLIASIYGGSVEDYVKIARHLQKYSPAIIELNISCPNKDDGMLFACNAELTKKLVKSVKRVSKIPIMPKLTPNVSDIGEIAVACEEGGADAISAINTVQKEIIHPELKVPVLAYGRGGISGPIIKKTAIEKIKQIRKAVDLQIVGIGGITYGRDAVEMIKAGASAVGIGSAIYFRGIDVFRKITDEMKKIMKKEKIKSIEELR